MLNDAQVAEIKARASYLREGDVVPNICVTLTSKERDALIADRDELVRRLATLQDAILTIGDKLDIYVVELVAAWARSGKKASPPEKHARLELSEAVDAALVLAGAAPMEDARP